MSICYLLNISDSIEPQSNWDDSFIGGKPKLPAELPIPSCDLCGKDQSFFFQVAFPDTHIWGGLSLAIFSCTSCVDENYLIPQMLEGSLKGANIPKEFLSSYQKNFRFLTFNTEHSTLRDQYKERVLFKRLVLSPSDDPYTAHNKVGGFPNWLLEDESPALYNSVIPMFFLLQLLPGFRFETLEDSEPQMELNLLGEPQPSPFPYYELFLGNAIYLFGTEDKSNPLIYAVTQVE